MEIFPMAIFVDSPVIVQAAGNKHKIIEEFIGNECTKMPSVSIARMKSPEGWIEPGQIPEFDEYTVVLNGLLRVETRKEVFNVQAGQAIVVNHGEWVRYSSPDSGGAEYIAVCIPAFSPQIVHRDIG
jgi:mannose-6-phosphate isomerase-like protein (cupin superfamily)